MLWNTNPVLSFPPLCVLTNNNKLEVWIMSIYQIIIPDKYCNTNVGITEAKVNAYLSDVVSWKTMDCFNNTSY